MCRDAAPLPCRNPFDREGWGWLLVRGFGEQGEQQQGGGVGLGTIGGRGSGGGKTGGRGGCSPPYRRGMACHYPHYSDKHLLCTLKTGTVSFIHIGIVKYLNRHFILPPLASGPGVTKCKGEESRGLAFRFRI